MIFIYKPNAPRRFVYNSQGEFNFDEDKHKRDAGGRFTSGGGGKKKKTEMKPAPKSEQKTEQEEVKKEPELTPKKQLEKKIYELAVKKIAHDKQARKNYEDLSALKVYGPMYEHVKNKIETLKSEYKKSAGEEKAFKKRELDHAEQLQQEYENKLKNIPALEEKVNQDDQISMQIEAEGKSLTRELMKMEDEEKKNSSPRKFIYRP